jgi:hypothetical protein
LAKYYGIDPAIFLAKPLTQLERDIVWTDRLVERSNIEASVAEM